MIQSGAGKQGYTLIEMAIVIALIGVLFGAALSMASRGKEHESLDKTHATLDELEIAIQRFFEAYDRIPCPASPTLVQGDAGYGIEDDCSLASPTLADIRAYDDSGDNVVWIGTVPVRSLGLPDRYMRDYWNQRITYAIMKDFADPTTAFNTTVADNTSSMLRVVDLNSYSGSFYSVNPEDVDNPAVYVLVSHGSDRAGAYNQRGVVIKNCPTTLDRQNCDHTDIWTNPQDVVFLSTQLSDSDIDSEYFYDLVRFKTKANFGWKLYAPDTPELHVNTVVTGEDSTCILRTDHAIACTGANDDGQLGDGTTIDRVDFTEEFNRYGDWVSLRGSGQNYCAIRRNGAAYCWGNNDNGQAGNAALGNISWPLRLENDMNRWSDIDVSVTHGCGINDGAIYCWGDNSAGQLATNDTLNRDVPTRDYVGANDWVSVSVGPYVTCGIRRGGRLFCAGSDANNLQPGGTSSVFAEINITGGDDLWSSVHVGAATACGLRNSRIYCWGDNSQGQAGAGSAAGASLATPTLIDYPIYNWRRVWVGIDNTCGTTTEGQVYCWGRNNRGQMGTGSAAGGNRESPERIENVVDSAAVAIEYAHGCSVSYTNRLTCWGQNKGTFGNGADTNNARQQATNVPDTVVAVP